MYTAPRCIDYRIVNARQPEYYDGGADATHPGVYSEILV